MGVMRVGIDDQAYYIQTANDTSAATGSGDTIGMTLDSGWTISTWDGIYAPSEPEGNYRWPINCPQCGAPLRRQLAQGRTITCEYCKSEIGGE